MMPTPNVLAGINFSLHYKLIKGDYSVFGSDPECRVFFAELFSILPEKYRNFKSALIF